MNQLTMPRYDYTVMPGQKWYGPKPGMFLEVYCATYREAAAEARKMWKAGVRDINIDPYDLLEGELANFYYHVDDVTGKIVKKK